MCIFYFKSFILFVANETLYYGFNVRFSTAALRKETTTTWYIRVLCNRVSLTITSDFCQHFITFPLAYQE